MGNLALIYWNQGNFEGAEKLLLDAINAAKLKARAAHRSRTSRARGRRIHLDNASLPLATHTHTLILSD